MSTERKIQATELRVGNWVKVEGTKTYCTQVTGGDILDYESGGFLKAGIEIHPIPLTPEILEKCGFKYNKIEGVARISDDFEEPEGDTEYWELGKLTIVSWDKGPLTLSNKSSFDHRIELTSLHQLQNLYFALTGGELAINKTTLKP